MSETAKVRVWAEEKINTGNFSNVTIGAEVTREVEDSDDVIVKEMREILHGKLEGFLAEERESLLKELGIVKET